MSKIAVVYWSSSGNCTWARIPGIIALKWKWDIRFITDLQKMITI